MRVPDAARALARRREFSLFLLLLALLLAVGLRSPRFFRPGNLYDILNDTALLAMVAVGQMMVIVTGGIDLSVASGVALCGMSVAMLNQYHPAIPIPAILLAALAVGLALGSLNGLLVARGGIPPIITTLGTLSIYRGLVFVLSRGEWVSAHEMSAAFRGLPRGAALGVTNLLLAALLVALLAAGFLRWTRTGREIYGAGGNRTAARYVGIDVRKIDYLVFAASGLIVGLAGLLWVARYASAQNETASGFELQTIAACVIGGVSITGGTGTVPGVILGALFLGVINNALPVINLSPFYQMAIQGFVILLAIVANTLVDRRAQAVLLRTKNR